MKRLICIACFIVPLVGTAQPELTLSDAIAIALKNNYDIRLVAKDVAIAETMSASATQGCCPPSVGMFRRPRVSKTRRRRC